ncbi:MAG: PAS domain S-box protein [Chthoniobacterales bacterium]|nr:PAS domain S-box protein [Chthoniobacterales bacterium]
MQITRSAFRHDVEALAAIIADNCAAPLAFNDETVAQQTLRSLSAKSEIIYAAIITPEGVTLADFGTSDDATHQAELATGLRIEQNGKWTLTRPVIFNESPIGWLQLSVDYAQVKSRLSAVYAGVAAAVLAASLILVMGLTARLQPLVTRPIARLADAAREVTTRNDYTIRAPKFANDELGQLTDAFNRMLDQIQAQDNDLQGAHDEVKEQVVALRHEIEARKQAEEARERLTAILEATPDFVGRTDVSGRVLYFNRAARRMIGLSENEDVTARLASEFHPEWANDILTREAHPSAVKGGTWAGETAVLTSARREIHVSQVVIAHKNPAGGIDFFSTIMRDMTERKEAEEALRVSQLKLLEISRFAGMAEVATGVLHNVGNVLNSVNVSAGLVAEKLRRSKAPKIAKAAAMLTERNGDLAEFLTTDPNGRKLPAYLAKLGTFLEEENADLMREVDQLGRNIEHIKEVVAMQQSYAKVSGVFENLAAEELVADAIAMNAGAFERHGITVERHCDPVPLVCVDRHKVLQILINLVRNGKHALTDSGRADKRLSISIASKTEETVCITVTDNGVGISPENLTRIFGHGFTTRKDGHGFGLHSGANAAQEIGGSLTASSQGLGKGASFVLELPAARTSTIL